jgi:DNA-binding NarL/FixJ family response regulator
VRASAASSSLGPAVPVTCFIADDHPAIVDAVSHLLEAEGRFEIVGHAADGAAALALIRELRPDVALVDLSMPLLDGVELTRQLAREPGAPRIVVYSGRQDPGRAREVIAAGAAGFVLKRASLGELARAVEVVAEGGTFLDPGLAASLETRAGRAEVTPREREVLALLADGWSNDEIARRLSISSLTVRTHVKHAMEKLHAGTRTEAVAAALRRSLI